MDKNQKTEDKAGRESGGEMKQQQSWIEYTDKAERETEIRSPGHTFLWHCVKRGIEGQAEGWVPWEEAAHLYGASHLCPDDCAFG